MRRTGTGGFDSDAEALLVDLWSVSVSGDFDPPDDLEAGPTNDVDDMEPSSPTSRWVRELDDLGYRLCARAATSDH